MKTITSPDNPRFKSLLALLQSSRERRKAGLSLLDGVHLIKAYRDNIGSPAQVAVSRSGLENREIVELLHTLQPTETVALSDALFARLSSVSTPTGILAVVTTPRRQTLPAHPAACLLLEDIQDPGNLGSILRSAAASGVKEIFLSPHCVHGWSPRVLRAGMGAHFMLSLYEGVDLMRFVEGYGGRVIAADVSARRSVFDADLSGGRIALLLGNEGGGLSRRLLDVCDEVVSIPMPGKTESLNVAAAAAVCLFERVRQLCGKRT